MLLKSGYASLSSLVVAVLLRSCSLKSCSLTVTSVTSIHIPSLLPPISVPLCYSFTLFSLRAFGMTYEIRPLLPDIHTHTKILWCSARGYNSPPCCSAIPRPPSQTPTVMVGPSGPWRRGQRPLIAGMTEASAGSRYRQELSAPCIALSFFHLWGPRWWHRP